MAFDNSPYEASRRDVNRNWATERATNDYARTVSQQRGARTSSDYRRDFGREQPGFMSQFGKRGLMGGGVNSGTFKRHLQRRSSDYARNLGRMSQDQAVEQNQYNLRQQQLDAAKASALSDIEVQRARAIAQTASNLRALSPLLNRS